MRTHLIALLLAVGLAQFSPLWGAEFGKDLVNCQIILPNGNVYLRGASDPVNELVVKLTLTNTTQKENKTPEDIPVLKVKYLTVEDRAKLENTETADAKEFQEQMQKALESEKETVNVKFPRINKDSIGVAYIPPDLGNHDLIEFEIKRLPDDQADALQKSPLFREVPSHFNERIRALGSGPNPAPLSRNMPIENTSHSDATPRAYLAPGESSPEYTLFPGKFYNIREPGLYSIKAIIRTLGNSGTPTTRVESNEEKFRVIPYKIVNIKVDTLQTWWEDYERGSPDFKYMVYQLDRPAPWKEIYYVQRKVVRGLESWEWHRLCTLDPNTPAQVQQVTPTKLAIYARHFKGDAALYTVDFSQIEPLVTSQPKDIGKKLKVEGETISVE